MKDNLDYSSQMKDYYFKGSKVSPFPVLKNPNFNINHTLMHENHPAWAFVTEKMI